MRSNCIMEEFDDLNFDDDMYIDSIDITTAEFIDINSSAQILLNTFKSNDGQLTKDQLNILNEIYYKLSRIKLELNRRYDYNDLYKK